jgi:deoxycytidine triphosphate deaminase
MAKIVTEEGLRNAVEVGSFIQGGVSASIEGIKYDFRVSNLILKAKFKRPIDAQKLTQSEMADLIVEPGEVVFMLSEERLKLPEDMFAQLSPKRKLSQAGVLTLGGLTIDPGYAGRLLVGLYNFSSTPFPIKPGKKLVAATFYKLEDSERGKFNILTQSLEEFPDELIEVMQKYRPLGTKFLEDGLERLQNDINCIKQELRDHEEWKERLNRHDEQIDNLIKGLEAEKQARLKGEDNFSKAIDKLNRTFLLIKGGAIALYAILALLLIPFLINWLPKLIELFSKK